MRADRASLQRLIESRKLSPRVVEAFRRLDRADFVPGGERAWAYDDRPVPLPRSQTTSQPSLIASMVDAAGIEPGDKVLEVGTGYGFQTALIASLAKEVVSVELYPELAEAAEANLRAAGFDNVTVVVGDGWKGYAAGAPYDAIVVSAAASSVPDALAAQLAEGGTLVIPVARRLADEVVVYRKQRGELAEERLLTPARFVPLVKGNE